MKPIRLITLAPGHFHAALVQKRMTPGVHRRAYVYGPLDRDTVAHVDRIAAFNARADDPTDWEVDLRAGPDWLERFLREQPGNTVVLSGPQPAEDRPDARRRRQRPARPRRQAVDRSSTPTSRSWKSSSTRPTSAKCWPGT